MAIRTAFTDLFICPISSVLMTDPWMNDCGHTFEKAEIDGWIAQRVTQQIPPDCPLCRAPIGNLVRNRMLKEGLDVLSNPDNSLIGRVEDLTDEEQGQVEAAAKLIRDRRVVDEQKGVPDRLPEPRSFGKKVKDAVKHVYGCN